MRTSLLLVLCAVPLAGCASAKVCDTRGETLPTVEANPTGLGMRLLSAGAEPRRALRYALEAGDHELSALEVVVGKTVATSEGAGEGLLPPIALELEAGPVEVREGGRFRYPLRVRDVALAVEAEPEAVAQAEGELAVLKDLGGWVEIDSRGVLRDRAIQIPPGVPRELALMLGNVRTAMMSVPFPEAPVGVGARWETQRDVEVSGLEARQTVTYTLRAVDGKGGSLEVVVHTSAPPQDIEGGRLHGYETSGMGSVELNFDRMTPLSEVDLTNQMRATVDQAGVPMALQTRTRTMLRLHNLEREREGQGDEAPATDAAGESVPPGEAE